MVQDVTVDLGSFSISSYLDKNFVLAVSTSALLSMPAQYPNIHTAADLRDQVQAGSLWIARAGSCHIELSIAFGDSLKDGSREHLQRMFVEAFEHFPVWDALGLDLRREYNQFNELRGSRSLFPYSVQHSQQNSGLVSPDQVPCAYLSILACSFTFGSRNTLVESPCTTTVGEPIDIRIVALPKKSKIVTFKAPPGELRRVHGIPEIYSLPMALQEKRLEHLTHTALHLVFGSRKQFSGIQFLKKSGFPTALEVAPAVWNSRYFQDVVSRAQLTSFVSSALGNLTGTKSPTLQRRIRSLGFDPNQEIHRRTILLVLRSARIPRLKLQVQRPSSQTQIGADSVFEDNVPRDLDKSQETLQEPEPEPHETSQDDPSYEDTLPHVETDLDAQDAVGTNLTNDDALTYESEYDVHEELDMEYGTPYPVDELSESHFITEDPEEPRKFSNDPLLDGVGFQNWTSFGLRNDGYRELQDDLTIDAMDEEYMAGVNVYHQEEPIGLAHRNTELELPNNKYYDYDSTSDTQFYDDDVDLQHYHQGSLDSGPERHDHLAYRQRFHEFDEIEDLVNENTPDDYWTEHNLLMGSGQYFPPFGAEQPQFWYDNNLVDVCYDTESLDFVTDRPLGELEEGYQYEHPFMQSGDNFTDQDTALVATGQQDVDETESFHDESHDEEEGGRNYDGAEDVDVS